MQKDGPHFLQRYDFYCEHELPHRGKLTVVLVRCHQNLQLTNPYAYEQAVCWMDEAGDQAVQGHDLALRRKHRQELVPVSWTIRWPTAVRQ